MNLSRLCALSLVGVAAHAGDIRSDLTMAARRLGGQTNYSWVQTRIHNSTNVASKFEFPLEGFFHAPATIYVRQRPFDMWAALNAMRKTTNPQWVEIESERTHFTNELVIVGARCAIKSESIPGDVIKRPTEWKSYSAPHPPLNECYEIDLVSPPHVELQQFVSIADDIQREPGGAFTLTLRGEGFQKLRASYVHVRMLAAEGWTKIWVSNALPTQYETRIVETLVQGAGMWGPLTNTMTNHTLTKILNVGTTTFEVPRPAVIALNAKASAPK